MRVSLRRVPNSYFSGLLAALMLAVLATPTATATAQRQDAATAFMQRVANALIDAQRKGTPNAFSRVIQRYGHIPAIGMDALGSYRNGLKPRSKQSYYRGLVKFISRYAATEGQKYPVARAEFPSPSARDGRHVVVNSRIHLTSGTYYDVRWLLIPRGRSFRVRDAQVVGFWVSPFLTRLFENYIRENGGRVDALVIALNQ